MHFHFIAIGGSAMHSLAIALSQKGYKITGSDDELHEPAASRLKKFKLLPEKLGWFPDNITHDIDAVILGFHAQRNNPELLMAQEVGLKIYSYPEFIFEQSREKTRVVISGSQGRRTITSMVLHVLDYHQKAINYLAGAKTGGAETTINLAEENDFIVLEGDEFRSSAIDPRPHFHHYQPNIALLSDIEFDDTNVFPSFEEYVDQFRVFIDSIVKGGILVYSEEDALVKQLVEASQNEIRKHPYHTVDHQVTDGRTFLVTPEGDMPVNVFGKRNMQNISGAKWICQHIGIDEEDFLEAISTFSGE